MADDTVEQSRTIYDIAGQMETLQNHLSAMMRILVNELSECDHSDIESSLRLEESVFSIHRAVMHEVTFMEGLTASMYELSRASKTA